MNDRPKGSDRLWTPDDAGTRRQLIANAAKFGLVAPLGMSALLAACGGDDSGGSAAADGTATGKGSAEGKTIGISWPFRSVAFFGAYQKLWHEEAEKAKVKILEPQAESEAPAQVEELNAWIERKVDALLDRPRRRQVGRSRCRACERRRHPGDHVPLAARRHRRRHVLRR